MAGDLEHELKHTAQSLGFELVGIAPATEADDFAHLSGWLAAGYAGTMTYLERQSEARRHPAAILPSVRSVVMVGTSYAPARSGDAATDGYPRVARYALGSDYHTVLWSRLGRLLDWLRGKRPDCVGRAVADTAPLMERQFARRAGLGWIGKNTLLIHRQAGSYLLLGALLTDVELCPDQPFAFDHCGSCTACLDACPTDAFPSPSVLNASRCISYLTIEHRGPIAEELRSKLGDWLFGCDVCQEVCPWNRKANAGTEPTLQPKRWLTTLDPLTLLDLDAASFRRRFAQTSLLRPKRQGLLRNAAIYLGNNAGVEALPALERALSDEHEWVRDAAAWAIAQIKTRGSS